MKQLYAILIKAKLKSTDMENTVRQLQSDEESPASSLSGVEAIFSNVSFSNRASSMYYYSVRSYLDISHSSAIHQYLSETDHNFMYSINSSALWLLLKNKIKRINKIQLFQNSSDKIVIKFAIIYASYMSLNEAKEKVMEKQKEALRRDMREFIQNKINKQTNRKTSILQQFNKSQFFNKKIVEQLKLNNDQKEELKSTLVEFRLGKNFILISFLQRCLNYLQKSIQKRDAQNRQRNLTATGSQYQGITRQAYSILLLCNYLNIYIVVGDWIKILLNDKEKRLSKLIFSHITEKKGFHIINRVLDDAPLNAIAHEIKDFQNNFYK